MSTDLVQVDPDRVIIALGRFRLGLRQNEELMRDIGAGQLVSVRRTFREQGSPANSWAPLAASTIKRDPKKYGSGHKLLIDKGTLLNSITFAPFTGGVTIGTNVVYARVHQFSSHDGRGAGGIGPHESAGILVGRKKRKFQPAVAYKLREVEGRDGTTFKVPVGVTRKEFQEQRRKGKRGAKGPSYESQLPPSRMVDVKAHRMHQNIPARPFLVIRPEDPGRIRRQVVAYVGRQRREAGLAGKDGA